MRHRISGWRRHSNDDEWSFFQRTMDTPETYQELEDEIMGRHQLFPDGTSIQTGVETSIGTCSDDMSDMIWEYLDKTLDASYSPEQPWIIVSGLSE